MIFLSAQPDTLYLKWQLEVFLFNVTKFNIPKEQIHVLIGYNPKHGINSVYRNQDDPILKKASFYFYPDNRVKPFYTPSIRPHILKQHFDAFSRLENEPIFYHDADIIFNNMPDFERLISGEAWYVSDTMNYTSASAIKEVGKLCLQEMADVLDIPLSIIEKNDNVSGGAQYIMKGLTYEFWDKVEKDSEELYIHLIKNKERYTDIFRRETGLADQHYNGIIEWCADMWAIIWNAFNNKVEVSVSDELSFCWPKDNLCEWTNTKIFHNAGLDKEDSWQYFFKSDFIHSTPYNTSFDYVRKDKCTIKYVEEIKSYINSLRLDFKDVTFLIPVRIDSVDRLNNLYTSTAFIEKYINTNFIVIEADVEQKVDVSRLPNSTDYLFIEDLNDDFFRTKYNNIMIERASTDIVVLQDTDVIISAEQLKFAVDHIRNNEAKICIPYDGCFKMVHDEYQIKHFRDKLDLRILQRDESYTIREKSCGGAVVLDRKVYILCGKENQRFYKWGPEDIERVRRMEILGFKAKWVDFGHLYHIRHEINNNSVYMDNDEYGKLMQPHVDVIAMTTDELKKDITTWNW